MYQTKILHLQQIMLKSEVKIRMHVCKHKLRESLTCKASPTEIETNLFLN